VFYNVRSRADFMTATIQPPVLAWAWRIAVGAFGLRADGLPGFPLLVRRNRWIRTPRGKASSRHLGGALTAGAARPSRADWPTGFALKKLTADVEKQIRALVKQAVS
jgi:hypothetical protein